MTHLIEVRSDDGLDRFFSMPVAEGMLSREAYARQKPDRSLIAVTGDAVSARCSLWWTVVPELPGHRLGVLGHYAATDAQAARDLINGGCAILADQGCTAAAGPMDGNTWNRYRLLTERGSEPVFFLEPDNPDSWPSHFREAGFETLAGYTSALAADLSVEDPAVARVEARLLDGGVTIRKLDPARFADELGRIHAVSRASFTRNFLYTPIAEADFAEQYRAIEPYVRPDFVELAEADGACVGFLFAIPDLREAMRGAPVETIVVKTVAVAPRRRFAGLGNVLVSRCHRAARAAGLRRAIHALMHESNNSRNLSGRYASTMRRYELYWKHLA